MEPVWRVLRAEKAEGGEKAGLGDQFGWTADEQPFAWRHWSADNWSAAAEVKAELEEDAYCIR